MRTRVRGWRWRRGALRRRSDVVEAWTVLVVAVLLVVGVPLAGAAAGRWAHDDARAVAAAQRAERHRVRAEAVGAAPDMLPAVRSGRQHAYRAAVRWTDPAGEVHTARARVPAGTRRGDTVDVWLDSRGRTVPAPPSRGDVRQHSLAVGACAAAGTAALVLLGHAVVRRVALGRRLAEWERAWARTGPEWTRRRA
ncbi:hypothetical protein ABT301_30160 [Streptomyces sp. NPDC000987]|uniref:Rv1733c family protein n=1 Tax=Streptomyces sp. NPDC000987 TaxID=3154374 RepID=UPI003325485F